MWGGRELRYVWSGMLPLCGLEEIFAPEVTRAGVRFGNPHLPEQAIWRNFTWQGKPVEAEAGPQRTRVSVTGAWSFLAEPGIAVRGFTIDDGIAFSAQASQQTHVQLSAIILHLSPTTVLRVNGAPAAFTVENGALSFQLPAGKTNVTIAKVA
jgi:hypothetical protein